MSTQPVTQTRAASISRRFLRGLVSDQPDRPIARAKLVVELLLESIPRLFAFARMPETLHVVPKGEPSARPTGDRTTCPVEIPFERGSLSLTLRAAKAYFQGLHDASRGHVTLLASAFAQSAAEFVRLSLAPGLKEGTVRSAFAAFDRHTVGRFLQDLSGTSVDFGEILGALTALGADTYENHRVTQGLVVLPGKTKDRDRILEESYLDLLRDDRKRVLPLSDGFRTAFVLDASGVVIGLESLSELTRRRRRGSRRSTPRFYPQWTQDMARATERNPGAVGIILTHNGEILVLYRGELFIAYRKGRWFLYTHTFNLGRLKEELSPLVYKPMRRARVARFLYELALDSSYRRTGALLAIVRRDFKERRLFWKQDLVHESTKGLRALFNGWEIRRGGREVWQELASLDGATVFSSDGDLLACGAIVRAGAKLQAGARARAAKSLSKHGLVLKVSSDGEIECYVDGKNVLELS